MSEETHIRLKAILEVVGKPKEFIEEKLKEYVEKIKEDDNLMIVSEVINDAVENEKVFSTYAEIELVIKGIENLVGFCIDYMPSSIEILKPENFKFTYREFTIFANDIVAKLHNVDMITKKVSSENKMLLKNLNNMAKNIILILLKGGLNKAEDISKSSGMDLKEVVRYLDVLKQEERINEEDNVYSLR